MQRHLLAGFAALLLVGGAVLAITDWMPMSSREFVSGTLLKVGVVLGLAWVAAPQLERLGWQKLRGTLLAAVVVVLILWSVRPRIGAIAAGVLVAGSLLFGLIGWFRQLGEQPRRK